MLVIHVQRFEIKIEYGRQVRRKLDKELLIEDKLKLEKGWCKEDLEGAEYELYAMSMHYGLINGGHYIAQVKYG